MEVSKRKQGNISNSKIQGLYEIYILNLVIFRNRV